MAAVPRPKARMMPRPLSTANLLVLQESESSSESDVEEEPASGSTRTSQLSSETGLGINLYDHKGVRKREVVTKGEAEQVLQEAIARKVAASPSLSSVYSPSGFPFKGSPSGFNLNGSSSRSSHSLFTPKSTPSFDLDSKPSLALIDQLLEENYRGQAETFVRSASASASRRSVSSSANRSVSSSLRSATASFDHSTPTRQSSRVPSHVHKQRADPRLLNNFNSSQSSPSASKEKEVVLESYRIATTNEHTDPSSPLVASVSPQKPGHCTYGYHILTVPTSSPRIHRQLRVSKRPCPTVAPNSQRRSNYLYFTAAERQAIADLVYAKPLSCEHHSNCTDCLNLEFAFQENKAMPTSMPPEERQRIINNNRSLRNIKNELESLAEHGAITDDVYDQIMALIPAESSLNSSSRHAAPSPAPAPTSAFNNLRINNDPPPPAYNTPTAPSLPNRQPSAPPSKPEIARAIALYRYDDPNDCQFEVGDTIAVYEYMNAEWWLGKNLRTGKEGVFPVSYVQPQVPGPASPHGAYGNEKANGYQAGGYANPYTAPQGPPPPGPSNPYNSSVPPMAIAEQPVESKPGKGQEMGKKFGKKLGNAAIFGAGATIGGNIVNSIF